MEADLGYTGWSCAWRAAPLGSAAAADESPCDWCNRPDAHT